MRKDNTFKLLALLELLACALAIILDIFLPTIIILGIGLLFIIIRKEKFSVVGFNRNSKVRKFAPKVFVLSVVWSLFDYGVVLPVLNHLTGTTQDLSTFEKLKGDPGQLLFLLALSWTLAAVCEEFAYRGFIQSRIASLFSRDKGRIVIALIVSSVLFGFAHTEQGIIGVAVTTIDALFFSILKYKYKSIWASVLAHGFMNSIGIITFYFTGPIYGLW